MKRKVIRYTIQGWDSCYKIRSRYWPRRFDPRCWIDGEEQVGDGYDYAEFETLSDAQAALRKCYPFATFSAERGNIIMSRHYIEEWACTLDEDGDPYYQIDTYQRNGWIRRACIHADGTVEETYAR